MYLQIKSNHTKIYKCRYINNIMVRIQKRENGYYLVHPYREGDKVRTIQKYLGNEIPDNQELLCIIDNFNYEGFQNLWEEKTQNIFSNYQEIREKLPESADLKNLINFGLRFTYNTNKIEGSRLSLKDVAMIYEKNFVSADSHIDQVNEAKRHMKLYEKMLGSCEEISLELILDWHNYLFELSKINEAGIFRNYPIQISMSNYTPPSAGIEDLMENLLYWYHTNKNSVNPVYLASVFHFRFESIHPFGDGNGRMGRLLMNKILYQHYYPMFNITFKRRIAYYNALEKANLNGFEKTNVKENEMFFISWFFKNYFAENQKYLS